MSPTFLYASFWISNMLLFKSDVSPDASTSICISQNEFPEE